MMTDLKKLRDSDPVDPSLYRQIEWLVDVFGEYLAGYLLGCENSSRWNLAMRIE
jgi:hypothetical protein